MYDDPLHSRHNLPSGQAETELATQKFQENTAIVFNGSAFDTAPLSQLRKLQDSSKFDKARFSFKLYKR